MAHRPRWIFALITVLLLLVGTLVFSSAGPVKEPAVAGAFYPADKDKLAALVAGYLSRAETPAQDGRLIALIAPHAGYEYSGQVAAFAYKHLAERAVDTVIILAPSHSAAFTGVSVYAKGSMRTPLGSIRINEKLAASLLNEEANVTFYSPAFEKEHSLEVQLPFLQTALKDFTIVPIVIGQPTRASFTHLTGKLVAMPRKNRNAIIIASTDLSHYHDDRIARTMDNKALDAITRMSVEDLEQALSSKDCELCGGYPVLFTMSVARQLGATHGVLYNYANSGDVTNDRARVVGYAALGLYQGSLSKAEGNELLLLARSSIESYVKTGKAPEHTTRAPRLLANGAAFVTINRNHQLRGCIGNIQPTMPLYRAVIANAVSACSRDPRFPPMSSAELRDMEVEVTVLSPLEPHDDVKDIRIGRHGLFLVQGMNSGILLPQVAEEYKWDALTFLEQVSVKAGLSPNAWKKGRVYTFTADIIK